MSAAVAEEPLREKLRWLLMLALYRCDRQAHALAVYTETRRLLNRELGIEPGTELSNLHQDILAGRAVTACREQPPALAPAADLPEAAPPHLPRPAQLPPVARGFVGRKAELDELDELERLLGGDEARAGADTAVAVVGGPAGMGKTALALRLAHRLADASPTGSSSSTSAARECRANRSRRPTPWPSSCAASASTTLACPATWSAASTSTEACCTASGCSWSSTTRSPPSRSAL
ncbi:BTAD domain-containing putative transcriptional regulator [Streptomyces sp. W1SF4]|uniref:AfsR/SARP family transcriptional regulator n=1 Tax=Streptomyces sp. W1SF4 TaxID=2305220 RepID=UPI001F49BF93|nr:BTAD domain-containing putative transcriptional regulator [Streptomyces sp. W1SF4]